MHTRTPMTRKPFKDRIEESHPVVMLGVVATLIATAAGAFSLWDDIKQRLGFDNTIQFELCLFKTDECASQNLAAIEKVWDLAGKTATIDVRVRDYGSDVKGPCDFATSDQDRSKESQPDDDTVGFSVFVDLGGGLSCTERFGFEFPSSDAVEAVWSEDAVEHVVQGNYRISRTEFEGVSSFTFEKLIK